jgi:hypothetical protein
MTHGPWVRFLDYVNDGEILNARGNALSPRGYPSLPLAVAEERGSGQEAWLEELLVRSPEYLLLDRIDPRAGRPILVGRQTEVTDRGALDLLFLDVAGVLTLVECKLAKNPELRREVLGQIVDYATYLSDLTYERLNEALSGSKWSKDDPQGLARFVWKESGRQGEPTSTWLQNYRKGLDDNLRMRRIRLVIVADRIDWRLRGMLEFICGGARPSFQLALVEIALYGIPGKPEQCLLVPSLHWSHTPSIPPIDGLDEKIQWNEQTFLDQTRSNNAGNDSTIALIEGILGWMKKRANALAPKGRLEWGKTRASWPTVSLRIGGFQVPQLAGFERGGAVLALGGLRPKHPESVQVFLEHLLNPPGLRAEEFIRGEKKDLWINASWASDSAVLEKVLAALEVMQDAIAASGA